MKRILTLCMSFSMLSALLLVSCGGPAAGSLGTPSGTGPSAPFEPLSLEAPSCDYGGEFLKIEAVDLFTVKFRLCYPDPAFPAKLAFISNAIQPREWLEANGGSGDLLDRPIGTGPYMISEWRRGEQLIMTRFEAYWGEPAKTPTLLFRWNPDPAQRLLELQAGTVDGIDDVSLYDIPSIQATPNLLLVTRSGLNTYYLGMNNTYPPFHDELVRQAIAMSIDRQRIVERFFPPGSEVADFFTPCVVQNGCTGEPWYEFNPERGRQLLAEAGYADGFYTQLVYPDGVGSDLPQLAMVAQDIQEQLKENLNIDAAISPMEPGAFLEASVAGELEGLHLLGFTGSWPDATNFLDGLFGAGSSAQFGEKWLNITDNLSAASRLAAEAERQSYYAAANNAIRQRVPMVPIAHSGSTLAYKAAVQGAHASPLGMERFAVMEIPDQDTFNWMQSAEPLSLFCADETEVDSLRACGQVLEPLLAFEAGGTAVTPALAERCEANADLTEWTCTLRQGVQFHDGSGLDANDVVASFTFQWDAANPLHTGTFTNFLRLFGAFLNAPPE